MIFSHFTKPLTRKVKGSSVLVAMNQAIVVVTTWNIDTSDLWTQTHGRQNFGSFLSKNCLCWENRVICIYIVHCAWRLCGNGYEHD